MFQNGLEQINHILL